MRRCIVGMRWKMKVIDVEEDILKVFEIPRT